MIVWRLLEEKYSRVLGYGVILTPHQIGEKNIELHSLIERSSVSAHWVTLSHGRVVTLSCGHVVTSYIIMLSHCHVVV